MILAGSMMVNLLVPGTIKSFGVLFEEFIEAFEATPSVAAWIPALCYFLYSSLGKISFIYPKFFLQAKNNFDLCSICRSIIQYTVSEVFVSNRHIDRWNICCIWNDNFLFCLINYIFVYQVRLA